MNNGEHPRYRWWAVSQRIWILWGKLISLTRVFLHGQFYPLLRVYLYVQVTFCVCVCLCMSQSLFLQSASFIRRAVRSVQRFFFLYYCGSRWFVILADRYLIFLFVAWWRNKKQKAKITGCTSGAAGSPPRRTEEPFKVLPPGGTMTVQLLWQTDELQNGSAGDGERSRGGNCRGGKFWRRWR